GLQFLETVLRADHQRLGIFDAPDKIGQEAIQIGFAFERHFPSFVIPDQLGIADLEVFDLLADYLWIEIHRTTFSFGCRCASTNFATSSARLRIIPTWM